MFNITKALRKAHERIFDLEADNADLVDVLQDAEKIINTNLYHQSEKIEDALSIMRAAIAKATM